MKKNLEATAFSLPLVDSISSFCKHVVNVPSGSLRQDLVQGNITLFSHPTPEVYYDTDVARSNVDSFLAEERSGNTCARESSSDVLMYIDRAPPNDSIKSVDLTDENTVSVKDN